MNLGKCNLFIWGNKDEHMRKHRIREARTVKSIFITINSNLKFNENLNNI